MCPHHACCSVARLPHVRGSPALRVLLAPPTPAWASVFVRFRAIPPTYSTGWRSRQDPRRSPRFLDKSISTRAVLSDPAGVSGRPRHPRSTYHGLPGFRPCRPPDYFHEAPSLHFRYGPRVALSTLHPCRHLHARKTRFPVRWLAACRGGNFTRWTRQAFPGAPKNCLRVAALLPSAAQTTSPRSWSTTTVTY